MSGEIQVRPARTGRQQRLFRDIAYRLRGEETFYTPPLKRDLTTLLNRKRHPFHEHAETEYFLAFRGRKCVGRIAAIENFAHNEFHSERIGFFGFLDAEEDPAVWEALLGAAERWAAARGLTAMRGPCSFSTNEECGLLVEGFETPPSVMTPWNPATWPRLLESCGYEKARDLWYWWVDDSTITSRITELADRVKEKFTKRGEAIVTRPMDIKKFQDELENVRSIYNAAWEKNWGFIPMTEGEISFLAKEMRAIIVPELVQFVEVDGAPAGFAFSLPDYNLALRHMKGRLGPAEVAIFFLLRSRIHQMRMLTMGVRKEWRGRGLETLLIAESIHAARARGIHACECGWILEDNRMMNRALKAMGCHVHRITRIYEKFLQKID